MELEAELAIAMVLLLLAFVTKDMSDSVSGIEAAAVEQLVPRSLSKSDDKDLLLLLLTTATVAEPADSVSASASVEYTQT